MFFMFYILVTMNSYMLDINCAIIQNSDVTNWVFNTKKVESSNRQSDTSDHTAQTVSYQEYFRNSKRSNKTYNLKSNIFDKMLSDEMLIIQQNLHRKDINQIPSVYISTANNAPTPTLEVKQKWSVMNFLSNTLNESYHTDGTQNETTNKINKINKEGSDNKQICYNNSRNKIVELRSLNESPDITSEYLENGRICTCMNTNTYTRCNHKCTGPIQEHITHSNTDHLCSRTITRSKDTQPNIPFFITTEMYNFYTVTPYPIYYTWIDDIKKKKSKHRKNKKPEHLHSIYYDNSEENNSLENTDFDDDIIEKIKHKINPDKDEDKGKSSEGKNVVINVEYEDKETLNNEKSDDGGINDILEQGEIQISDKDKFTNQIVSDLKKYYNDVVIKDCYYVSEQESEVFCGCCACSSLLGSSLGGVEAGGEMHDIRALA
ncbi:PREDICTED: uncharacterized protein LOC106115541 [Papilio xuthus]|uniref:Uncharacterized protein LOC106115541 n=1 Tax=Papilio xuthus TaxID=66420 RepID=A0AAJ6Z339_PAPXU|nr:PREDICTED: uncharacterized protein LOC106115541 [Papilio xuthus]